MSENMPQSSATTATGRNAKPGGGRPLERKDGARYEAFLHSKVTRAPERGLVKVPALHPSMFPHQRDVTEFLLRAGSGAATHASRGRRMGPGQRGHAENTPKHGRPGWIA